MSQYSPSVVLRRSLPPDLAREDLIDDLRIGGLGDMRIEARGFCRFDVARAPIASQGHQYHVIKEVVLANPPCDVISSHDRQPDIDQREIRMLMLDGSNSR